LNHTGYLRLAKENAIILDFLKIVVDFHGFSQWDILYLKNPDRVDYFFGGRSANPSHVGTNTFSSARN
jgi:hypothetical protein